MSKSNLTDTTIDLSDLTIEKIINYLIDRRITSIKLEDFEDKKDQLSEGIKSYTKDLYEKSWDQLVELFHDENSKQSLEKAIASIIDDKHRFFNQPNAKADYLHYCQLKTWTREQAIALSLGRDPNIVNSNNINRYMHDPKLNVRGSDSQFAQLYNEQKTIIYSDPTLSDCTSPSDFLTWFNSNQICVDRSLRKISISLGLQKTEQYVWMENLFDDEQANSQKQLEIHETEKESMLKLILGMALDKYEYNNEASRNKASGAKDGIAAALKKWGLTISDDTVRKYLKAASAIFGDNLQKNE